MVLKIDNNYLQILLSFGRGNISAIWGLSCKTSRKALVEMSFQCIEFLRSAACNEITDWRRKETEIMFGMNGFFMHMRNG